MEATTRINPLNPPQPEDILGELEAIARSGKVSEQPLRILRFVVTETLAGRAEEIKESTVGVYALGLDPSKVTTVVRAHVFKLRSQLKNYYDSQEIWRVRVIIEIPKGAYRPEFSYPDPEKQFGDAEAAALRSAQTAIDRLTLPELNTALATLDEILKMHPNHPLVLAMKADVHTYRAIHGLPPRQEIEIARQLAERAVTIAPGMWQTQTTYGYVQAILRNWDEAHAAFEKVVAIPKAPGTPTHPSYISYLPSQGRTEEAIRLVKEIVDSAKGYYGGLAPSKPIVRADLGFNQLLAGRLEDSIQTLDSAMKDSNYYLLFIYRAMAQEALDDPAGAFRILCKTPIKWSETTVLWGMKALFLGLNGSRLRARIDLLKLQIAKHVLRAYVPASQFLLAYLGVGAHQKAIHSMRQMVLDCDPLFLWLGHYPFGRHLADLPEFHSVLKEAGLVWRWHTQ